MLVILESKSNSIFLKACSHPVPLESRLVQEISEHQIWKSVVLCDKPLY